ncbi:MAG: hypothetical protein AB7I38_11810 [Dehalococcoidia bacterium]
MVAAEELRAGTGFDDGQEASVAGPGEDPGDSAAGAAASLAETSDRDRRDESRGPVHAAHELVEDRGPCGAPVAAPVLAVDELIDQLKGLALALHDPHAGLEEVAPARMGSERTGGEPLYGAAAAGRQRASPSPRRHRGRRTAWSDVQRL